MSTFKDKLKAARLPERSVPICLRGDLVADFEAAEHELKQAQESSADSKEGAGVGPIIERIDALRAEMLEHTEEFRLRAMPSPDFHAFRAEHPPRRDDEGTLNASDVHFGFNVETFFGALLRASIISPELDEADWDALLAVLTDQQYGSLTDAAWFLNRDEVKAPFSSAASLAKRNSGGE
jgi:hypothetical protein